MKKMLLTLLALLMLLACVPACADFVIPTYNHIPQDVQDYLDTATARDGVIVDSFIRPAGGDTAFVAITDDGIHRLLCFEYTDARWVLRWNRKNAMPDPDQLVALVEMSGKTYNGMSFGTAFGIHEAGSTGWESYYELDGSVWKLRMLCWHDTDGTLLETYRVESGVVKYEGWRKNGQQRIYGTLQSDLRYFSWRDFPFDPDELRAVMSNPPSIPDGTLSAKRIQFTGGKKYPVYNGPGEEYGQSGNGNAHVSTNDWIQVFGEEDGWIMIQYDITRDHMRIGWIEADALPGNANVQTLRFTPVPARMAAGTNMTDDPLGSQETSGYIREGMSVQWLATMGSWAYVESTDGSLTRGFVPMARLVSESEWEK